jgi:heme A synthase
VLGWNLAVILWGAYVRASGSGAGCGSHWPLCNGEVMPRTARLETLIEFAHRITSGVALISVIGLAAWAFRAFPRRHPARTASLASGILIITEALLGAGLVLFEYVAGNASTARAVYLSGHLVTTLLLLAAVSLAAWFGSGRPAPRLGGSGSLDWVLGIGIMGVVVLGISGVVAALGDTLFPSASVASGLREDFSPAAHVLIRLRLFHPVIAAFVSAHLMFAAVLARVRSSDRAARAFSWTLSVLVLLQLALGVVNVTLLAPVWLQLIHLLLADALWLALILLSASALSARDEAPFQEFATAN